MPLFIDLHIDTNLTLDIIKQCHVADKAIQARYGVRYLQILVNQPQGYLFCLIEGPDKESCAKVHQEAHGNIACNILEITQSDFSALLADKQKNVVDFTLNHDGTLDTGNRNILAVSLLGSFENSRDAKEIIKTVLHQKEGRTGESFENQLMAVFDSASWAIDAGLLIGKKIAESSLPVEVRMGVSVGPPLEEKGNFFEDVRRSADRFSFVSMNGQVTVPSKIMQQLSRDVIKSYGHSIKVISPADEKFLNQLMACTEKIWDKHDMTIADFSHTLGMSKSQLTRRLRALSHISPNDFIKEVRLRRSIRLMEDQDMNIAEVAMAIGFSNPSYFTKCFRKRFGKAPSDYTVPGDAPNLPINDSNEVEIG
jgi:AraC-like DNA-binding protein